MNNTAPKMHDARESLGGIRHAVLQSAQQTKVETDGNTVMPQSQLEHTHIAIPIDRGYVAGGGESARRKEVKWRAGANVNRLIEKGNRKMDNTRVRLAIVHPRTTRVLGRLNLDKLNVGMI